MGRSTAPRAAALMLAASLAPAAGAGQVEPPPPEPGAPTYEVLRAPEAAPPVTVPAVPALDAYSVDAVRALLPERLDGRDARVEPIDRLYFLHSTNVIVMDRVWQARGMREPTCVVLARGSYSLESVWRQVDDPAVLSREPDGSYLLKRPLWIAPTATLAVAGERLRLATDHGTFLYSHGTLMLVDSQVLAWDADRGAPSARQPLDRESVLLYGEQSPRPYILASEGSRTFIAGSHLQGLGFKSSAGTFGLSLTPTAGGGRLAALFEEMPKPTGQIVGNRIVDFFFGFYSHEAEKVALVGNLFEDNVVYAIDPHDYSTELVVARNVTQGSHFKHGIIFSRGVSDSWVVENLSVANGGSGVMMDRASSDNLIADNLVLANDGDGIAIFESDRNVLRGNHVARNLRNGILVRNSATLHLTDNHLLRNGRSGLEIATADISYLETRDFVLDPYRRYATALVEGNTFDDNVRSAVAVQAAHDVTLHANRYPASGPLYFDGDLERHSPALIAAELRRETPVTVRRENASPVPALPAPAHGEDGAATRREPGALLAEHARRGDPLAMLGLARFYVREREDPAATRQGIYWYGRAIRHARVSAMSELGVALVTGAARNETERREGLVLLAMAARMADRRADMDLTLLPDLVARTSRGDIEQARRRAAARLASGELWNGAAFADVRVELGMQETYEAKRRVKRLINEPRVAKPFQPPRLDPSRRGRLEDRMEGKNSLRARLNERRREERLAAARAEGEPRAHLDRIERRERGAQLRTRTWTEREWQEQQERVRALLDKVNRHRAADDPLRLEDVRLPERAGTS